MSVPLGLKSSQYAFQYGAVRLPDAVKITVKDTTLSGNNQHGTQGIGDWINTQLTQNQSVVGSPAAWDTASRRIPFANTTQTASFNLNLSNVKTGASGVILINKNTASDITVTFGGAGLTHNITGLDLSGALNEVFKIRFDANGTVINWSLVTATGQGSTYTPGSFVFAGASGNLIEDNANLFYDNTGKGIGFGTVTPSTHAVLDIVSTTKGLLVPRMTTVQKDAIVLPDVSLLLFDTDVNTYNFNSGSPAVPVWTGFASSPGGVDGNIQYNNSTAFGGETNMNYDDTNKKVTLTGNSTTAGNVFEAFNSDSDGFSFHNTVGLIKQVSTTTRRFIVSDAATFDGTTSTDNIIFDFGTTGVGTVGSTCTLITTRLDNAATGLGHVIVIGDNNTIATTKNNDYVAIGTDLNIDGNDMVLISGRTGSALNNSVGIGRGVDVGASSIAVGFDAGSASFTNYIALGQSAIPNASNLFQAGSENNTINNAVFGTGHTGGGTAFILRSSPNTTSVTARTMTIHSSINTFAAGNGGDLILKGTTGAASNGTIQIQQSGGGVNFESDDTGWALSGSSPTAKEAVTGSTAANAALQDLLTKLDTKGIITDSTT